MYAVCGVMQGHGPMFEKLTRDSRTALAFARANRYNKALLEDYWVGRGWEIQTIAS